MNDVVLEKFNNTFINNPAIKSIVIYGTADCAKKIITNISSTKIKGLMDQKKTGEVIYGQKVLSYEEVEALDNPVIVIAARTSVIKIVYRRIKDFCEKNSIDVYDVNGELLVDEQNYFFENACFNLDYEKLQKKIDEAEIISFDIFDTLICRKVLRPRDVFQLVDKKTTEYSFQFSRERIKAEEELNIDCVPNIYQIYDRLSKNIGISESCANNLLELEIQTEKDMLYKRDYMCNLLGMCQAGGKIVILVSDMYFTSDIIKDMLKDFGIEGYDKLYISCEYGIDKTHGLFESVIKDIAAEPKTILHIGDNSIADYKKAKEAGINAFRIYSVNEMLERSGYSALLVDNLCFEENCIVARFAADVYNNPFSGYDSSGKIIFEKDEDFVRALVAPVIFKYSLWILQKIKEKSAKKVLFPSRDGYLLEKLYLMQKKYFDLPDSKYVYVSRRATMVAAADSRDLLNNILEFPDDRSFREMIISRFSVDLGEMNSIKELDERACDLLLEACRTEKNNYLKYIENEITNIDSNTIFTDLVAMGRIQEAFQRLIGRQLFGAYFVKRISDGKGTQNLTVDSLYPVEDDYSATSKVYQYYYLLECIMTSAEPSLLKFDDNGRPLFFEESRSDQYLKILDNCHRMILEYSEEMLKCLIDYDEWKADIKIYDMILGFFSQDYSIIKDSILLKGKNIDEFMGKEVTNYNR